jgi:phospholipid transport system substrate-binding protein
MTIIGSAALLTTTPWSTRYAWAQSDSQAVIFVQSTTERLVAVVNGAGPPEEKRRQLLQVIDATVDVDDIARFCLGQFWRIATPDQQAQYLLAFHDLLVTEIAGHLGEYKGVRVTLGVARASADTEIVITTVERPNNPTTQVDWVVSTATGSPKVVDLLAGGTSMRLTKSADFTAYLARHQFNIHELVEAMRQQLAQNG